MRILSHSKYKIAAVSYINTIPMLEGIKLSGLASEIDLTLATPAECAKLFHDGQVDIALLPVGALPELNVAHIITDYCIGCVGAVRTVVLFSNVALDSIKTVQLDADSRTSNLLVQVLANEFFKKKWNFIPPKEISETHQSADALLAIGDKVFEFEDRFKYVIDLGQSWQAHTSLPFVFAVWVSKEKLPNQFEQKMNDALQLGIHNIPNIHLPNTEMRDYLEHYISFTFDKDKKKALELFFKKIKRLKSPHPLMSASL